MLRPPDDDWVPSLADTPYDRLGGRERVEALAQHFYDAMERLEPELAALHRRDASGHITDETRGRFALFLVGWLGGPQDYMAQHGHPRLRMRHARVAIHSVHRDAWLRCMKAALDTMEVRGGLRQFLDGRFAQV